MGDALLADGVDRIKAGKLTEAVELLLQAAEAEGDRTTIIRARALGNAANAYARLGQHERALEVSEQSAAVFRALGERGGEATVLFNAALSHEKLGRVVEACKQAAEAITLATDVTRIEHCKQMLIRNAEAATAAGITVDGMTVRQLAANHRAAAHMASGGGGGAATPGGSASASAAAAGAGGSGRAGGSGGAASSPGTPSPGSSDPRSSPTMTGAAAGTSAAPPLASIIAPVPRFVFTPVDEMLAMAAGAKGTAAGLAAAASGDATAARPRGLTAGGASGGLPSATIVAGAASGGGPLDAVRSPLLSASTSSSSAATGMESPGPMGDIAASLAQSAAAVVHAVGQLPTTLNAPPSALASIGPTPASVAATTLVPAASAAPMMVEFGYENLWFGDVIARHERGLAMLEEVEAMVRARSAASEAYARSLHDSGHCVDRVLSATGLGVAPTLHLPAKQGGGGVAAVAAAARSVMSFLGGPSSSSSSSPALSPSSSSSSSGQGGVPGSSQTEILGGTFDLGRGMDPQAVIAAGIVADDGTPAAAAAAAGAAAASTASAGAPPVHPPIMMGATVVTSGVRGQASAGAPETHAATVNTGGYDSLTAAISGLRRQYARDSFAHHTASGGLKDLAARLASYRGQYTARASRELSRAMEAVRHTQAAVAHQRRAALALERAQREEADATYRYQSAATSGATMIEVELSKRLKRVQEMQRGVEEATQYVTAASEIVANSRQARDGELTFVAQRMQALDEERAGTLANALRALAGAGHRSAQEGFAHALQAVSHTAAIDTGSDERLFVHQRRVAVRLDEMMTRYRVRAASTGGGGGGDGDDTGTDPDDASRIVPSQLSQGEKARSGRAYIDAEKALAPMMFRWVTALLKDEGYERLDADAVAPEFSSADFAAKQQQKQQQAVAAAGGASPAASPATDASTGDASTSDAAAAGTTTDGAAADADAAAATGTTTDAATDGAAAAAADASTPAAADATAASDGAASGSGGAAATAAASASSPPAAATSVVIIDPVTGKKTLASPDWAHKLPFFEVTLLHEPAARHAFLRALSARRSVQQLVSESSFRRLCRVLWWALDACRAQEDARGAGTVLILSETYYRTITSGSTGKDDGGAAGAASAAADGDAASSSSSSSGGAVETREYVQTFVKRHPIWCASFWHESFYRAVRDEVGKLIDPLNGSNSRLTSIFAAEDAAGYAAGVDGGSSGASTPAPAARPASGGGGGAPVSAWAAMIGSDGDAQYAYSQIVFGQLMALVVNMTSFDARPNDVKATVQRLAIGNGLSREYVQTLMDTVAAQRAAAAAAAAAAAGSAGGDHR